MIGFILLNDPKNEHQRIIRGEHVSAAESRREDGIVSLSMLSGERIVLTQEESRQFIQHTQPHHAQATQRIRELAYRKWEEAGRPLGDGKNSWYEAEQELLRISRLIRPHREGSDSAAGVPAVRARASARPPSSGNGTGRYPRIERGG
jgi:hypothetical protein